MFERKTIEELIYAEMRDLRKTKAPTFPVAELFWVDAGTARWLVWANLAELTGRWFTVDPGVCVGVSLQIAMALGGGPKTDWPQVDVRTFDTREPMACRPAGIGQPFFRPAAYRGLLGPALPNGNAQRETRDLSP